MFVEPFKQLLTDRFRQRLRGVVERRPVARDLGFDHEQVDTVRPGDPIARLGRNRRQRVVCGVAFGVDVAGRPLRRLLLSHRLIVAAHAVLRG